MRCPHCGTTNSDFQPFTRAVESGRAYAQVCSNCGRILGIRPRLDIDPPAAPPELTVEQIAKLRFVRWRLQAEVASLTEEAPPAA